MGESGSELFVKAIYENTKRPKQCKHRYGDWCHNPKQEHQEHCAFYLTNQNYENCSWFELNQKE